MVKFIHAADLHMDRSFEGLTNVNKSIQKELLNVNLKVLSNIVEQAIKYQVDFVLLAGDSFHQNRPSLKIQKNFFEQMNRLSERNIPVYMIFGNHDFYQQERYWFDFPKNIFLFPTERVETKELVISSGEKIAISGFSYEHPRIQKEKITEFPSRLAVNYHLGLYHGEVGSRGQGNYAPFQPSKLQAKGYDYWALGHIHTPTVLNESGTIVYPGSPQGHTQKEKESLSILLVELTKNKCHRKPLEVAQAYWKEQEISLKYVKSVNEIIQMIKSKINFSNEKLILLSIELIDYNHLGHEVIERIYSDELVEYFSEELAYLSSSVFIWRIFTRETYEGTTRIPLSVSERLIDQIFGSYRIPENFHHILNEAYTHPEAIKLIHDLSDFQKQTLEKAKELLNQDFLFEEGID